MPPDHIRPPVTAVDMLVTIAPEMNGMQRNLLSTSEANPKQIRLSRNQRLRCIGIPARIALYCLALKGCMWGSMQAFRNISEPQSVQLYK